MSTQATFSCSFFAIGSRFVMLVLHVCRVVEFATYSDMKNAIDKLDDTEIGGKRVRIEEDKPRGGRRRR